MKLFFIKFTLNLFKIKYKKQIERNNIIYLIGEILQKNINEQIIVL